MKSFLEISKTYCENNYDLIKKDIYKLPMDLRKPLNIKNFEKGLRFELTHLKDYVENMSIPKVKNPKNWWAGRSWKSIINVENKKYLVGIRVYVDYDYQDPMCDELRVVIPELCHYRRLISLLDDLMVYR